MTLLLEQLILCDSTHTFAYFTTYCRFWQIENQDPSYKYYGNYETSQRPRCKHTGQQASSDASIRVLDPCGSRQMAMQVCPLGSLLAGIKDVIGKSSFCLVNSKLFIYYSLSFFRKETAITPTSNGKITRP